MTLPQILGYAAAILLIVSFAMKGMTWLRLLAIASSIVLAVYAIVVSHWPVLGIAVLLAAVNLWRLYEMRQLSGAARAATAASAAPLTVDWLLPYMRPLDVPKDQILFRKGDVADAVYFLSSGRVRFEEIGVEIGKGTLFGEIGALSVDQIRTATAKCMEPCSLLRITGEKLRELYYQNPEFGFALVGLITRRLLEDLQMARPVKP